MSILKYFLYLLFMFIYYLEEPIPIQSKNVGGWTPAFLLLANQGLATFAFFGVGLIVFLTRVSGQGNIEAINSVSKWNDTIYFCSMLGSFLSNSYLGSYLTSIIYQLILVMGLFILSLTSWQYLVIHVALESDIKSSRKILQSKQFKCLDKAVVVTEKDLLGPRNHWRPCTVNQVEEVKCVIRMLPIWLCTIIYSIIFTQMASLFVEQGATMNAYVGTFHLPAANMSIFDIVSVLLCTLIYRKVLPNPLT